MPGVYFVRLLIGYFEGIDSERGIAWRLADSLALRGFCGSGWTNGLRTTPTISRTRAIDGYRHASRRFVLVGAGLLAEQGLLKGPADGHRQRHLESELRARPSMCVARHWETYDEFLARIGEGVWDGDADARGPCG